MKTSKGNSPQRIMQYSLIILLLALLGACNKGRDHAIRVHITSNNRADIGEHTEEIKLPVSGIEHSIHIRPILIESGIENIELVQLDLGKAIMIQYDLMSSRELYRMTTTSRQESLVFIFDHSPLGARIIDAPIQNGQLIFFLEMPDSDLVELVMELKQTIQRIQKSR